MLNTLPLKCKIVLHFDSLLVSKIGPRANSILTAIGHPIHRVAKLEKEISSDTGRATEKFFQQVRIDNRKFLCPIYEERQIPEYSTHIPPITNSLASFLNPNQQPIAQPQFRIKKNLIGYDLRWPLLFKALELT